MPAYRILLIGGPEDGDSLVVPHPYYLLTTGAGNRYEAELDAAGEPVTEDGDGGADVECVTPSGDAFAPALRTIRMHYAGRAR